LATEKGDSSDDIVYIPLKIVQQYFSGSDSLSTISLTVENETYIDYVQEEITQLLLSRHNISDVNSADFSITNLVDIQETISSTTQTFTILLGAIAAISLIVGGIGIMNMMLTTVTERTKEIGLRKALGAQRKDITSQFLMESALITIIGGVIGIIFGITVSILIEKITGTTTLVSLYSIILAFCVSAAIGIVFGYYPARRASLLDPIDALRYE
jgi:putative ABC transport system permease protein